MADKNNEQPIHVIPESGYYAHDPARPQPPIVTPGVGDGAPSDATVLFDGTDLAAWEREGGGEPGWQVEGEYMEVVPRSGGIVTKASFGTIQLHLEFASPSEVVGEGQGRGNSGVFMMDRYEIQVLDSYENPTYADGVVGGIYSQWPPLVNVIRGPGEWNTCDLLWEVPVFDGSRLVKPAFLTLFLNGVVVHHHVKVLGPTRIKEGELPCYKAHQPAGPIMLQDHGNPVRFRNIWVRDIGRYK